MNPALAASRALVRMSAMLLVRFAARIVPRALRVRWREEWHGEVNATAAAGRALDVARLATGVLKDAILSRWTTATLPPEGGSHARGWGDSNSERNMCLPPSGGSLGGKHTRTWPPDGSSGWRGPWHADAKQTIRSLARSPWHVLTVSLCLGIGVAVTVTVFSILAAILTGTLPGVLDRGSVMRLYLTTDERWGPSSPGNASIADYEILKRGARSIPDVSAEGHFDFAIRTPGTATVAVEGAFVSGNYFAVLGTQPAFGRLLTPADDSPGAPPAAVLSHSFWTVSLGSPPAIVGSTIVVGGQDVYVAGIAPPHFSGMDVGDLGEPPGQRYKIYVPLSLAPMLGRAIGDDERWLAVIGRATANLSGEAFAAELQPLAAQIEAVSPKTRKNAAVLVLESGLGPGDTTAMIALIVTLLMAAPLTVLAIGCANVANLQLVRASLRARELAVRLAVGASRAQLMRLLTFESVVLAGAACVAGALGTNLLLRLAALVVPFHVALDWPVLLFSAGVAVLVVIATGLIPAWLATRPREAVSLGSGTRSTSAVASRVRRALVVAQIALSLLLLLTAGLFTRGLEALAGRVPAVAHDVVVAEIRFDTLGYTQPQRTAYVEAFQQRLRSDARVQAVGINTVAPLRGGGRRFWLPDDSAERLRAAESGGDVTPQWFEAAGLRLLRGRLFTSEDVRLGNAAIVDQAFIDRYRLAEPVVGSELRVERSLSAQRDSRSINQRTQTDLETVAIVGVVSNGMTRPIFTEARPGLYLPLLLVPDYAAGYVRASQARDVLQQVRQTMAAIDPNLPPVEIATLATRFIEDTGDIRLLAQAAAGLGTTAFLLAVAGVYSVVAFFVSLRIHEFGIRLAIGARPRDIVTMVVFQTARLVGVGLLAGIILAIPVLIGLGSAFPYTSAFDPTVFVVTAGALALTALAAASLPARKAARVDPCAALRSE